MKENDSDKNPSDSRVSNATDRFFKSADSFFHKPESVFWICVFLFGLTAWTFFPALKTEFQYFDDNGIFLSNAHINTGLSWQNLRWALFSTDYSYSYPLCRISHMLDFEMFGTDPWGHHLTNVLLHSANGVLLFLVLKRMTGALWRSLIVAALFALHPLRVESVVWISERKDVLSTFFGLLALWMYVRFAEESKMQGGRTKLCYVLTLLFFAFSLMSKAMLVTFPFVLLLLDYWPLERWRQKSKWGLVLEKVPFFLLVVPVSLASYFAQKAGGSFILHLPLFTRLETAVIGYARYLGKMFWPTNLSILYPYPDFWPMNEFLCAIALILGISVLAFTLQRQRPYFLVGWLWYLGTLVPVIGLIPLGGNSLFNRFTYIPMVGILLLLVWAVYDLSKQWRHRTFLIASVVALVSGVCIFRTRGEIVYWKNGETLWRRAIAITEKNFAAHHCLAEILSSTNPDEALAEYQKSEAIYPDYALTQLGLAWVLSNKGRVTEAIAHYEKAIRLEPQNAYAQAGLVVSLFQSNRAGDAIPHLLKAIEIDPQFNRFKDVLGQELSSGDHGTETMSNILAVARSDPTGFGKFLEAMQFDTNRVDLVNNLAWAFATHPDPKLRNGNYAGRLATRACEMTGYQSTIMIGTLAAAYAEAGRFDEAVATGQRACALAEKNGEADLLKRNQELVKLYQAHQAYHEPAAARTE